MTQQVEITRTYEFPDVPGIWEWTAVGAWVFLYDDALDCFGKVSVETDAGQYWCESTVKRFHPSMLEAASDLATEATEWQATIDEEAAQAPVIDGQPVYCPIPLALRRKGWWWVFADAEWFGLRFHDQLQPLVRVRDMTRQEVADAMADLVSDAETAK